MSDETRDENVGTAVEFLKAVAGQGHREQQLRSYLKKKQGLSNEQVEIAFQKHRTQQNMTEDTVGMQDKTDWTESVDKSEKPLGANSELNDKKVKTAVEFLIEAFENKEGNSEQKLRSYLESRQGLSSKQVDEAFRLCRIRQEVQPSPNVEEKSDELVGAQNKSADWKVETVVEFLIEIEEREEDYPEQKLRQYLEKRRGLSKKQIDKAFRIYRIRQSAKEKHLAKTEGKSNEEVFAIGDHNATAITNVDEVVDQGSIPSQESKNEAKEVTSVDLPVAKIETGFNEPSAKFRTWSADHVARWVEVLESGKFKAYAKHFEEIQVDGALLSVLSNSELNYFFEKDLKIQNADVRSELAQAVRSKTKNLLEMGKRPKLEEYKEKTEPNLDEIYVSLKNNANKEAKPTGA